MLPLAVSQAASVLFIVMGAIAMSARWVPRDRFSRLGIVAGLLAGTATICFQLAVQSGMLTIAAVLTSLYPAITVLLREDRITRQEHGFERGLQAPLLPHVGPGSRDQELTHALGRPAGWPDPTRQILSRAVERWAVA